MNVVYLAEFTETEKYGKSDFELAIRASYKKATTFIFIVPSLSPPTQRACRTPESGCLAADRVVAAADDV